MLESLGAGRLDADRAGHEVLRQPDVIAALRERWGDAVLTPDEQIDRAKVAGIVFSDPAELQFLEQTSHPHIGKRLRDQAAELERSGAPALVLDAAVMLKTGWDKFCDIIVFVDAPQDVRASRAMARGWTTQQFAAREAAQENLEEKRKCANCAIDNSGSREATFAQVKRLWETLMKK